MTFFLSFGIIFMFLNFSYAEEIKISPSANFGGGLNVGTIASEIADNESPDMNNMISDLQGASFKRKGSRRYISTAISTNPITSMFRAYASTGTNVKKVLLVTSKDRIYKSTTDISPFWVNISSGYFFNAKWSFVQYNNDVIMTNDSLENEIIKYNVIIDSVTEFLPSTPTVRIRGKYLLNSRDQLLIANVVLMSSHAMLTSQTTYYPSKIFYTDILLSTLATTRSLDFYSDDGESITGLSQKDRMVHIWKPTKIGRLEYTTLAPVPTGDQILSTIVDGFGLYAPRSLANNGNYYIFAAKDGIRFWDGSQKTRLQVEQESQIVSNKIKSIVERCIRAGTWQNVVGYYYAKKQAYIMSYEDPDRSPRGKNNSILVLDLITGNWYPFKNWLAESFVTFDGHADDGRLLYGDSNDGYVHIVDLPIYFNDSRKEISVHPMDSEVSWTSGTQSTDRVQEGTASIRMPTLSTTINESSITYMAVLNLGEWYDKTKVTKDDKLFFRVNVDSIPNLISLRIDLEVEHQSSQFDTIFTSVTISSGTMNVSSNTWTTVEVNLSSFPLNPSWLDINIEDQPFADALTFYGIRFVASGTAGCNVYIDDVRIVQDKENSLNAYRVTKQLDFGTLNKKTFKQIYLNAEIASDGAMNIDILKDFGDFVDTKKISYFFTKDIFVTGFYGGEDLTKINSIDFSAIISTRTLNNSIWAMRPIWADENNIWGGDQRNHRIIKLNKDSFITFVSTFGSFGSGTENFNIPYEIDGDDNDLWIIDHVNNRVKVYNKINNQFVKTFGTLGRNTTSYHAPTGIAVDGENAYIGNDGNQNILKITKSTGGLVAFANLDINTIGDISLQVDQENLFCLYNKIDPESIDHIVVILEKRLKTNLELVKRIIVYPENSIARSTYSVTGTMGQSDDFLYVSFTDDTNGNGSYYIQKILKEDFSLVRQLKSSTRILGLAGIGYGYKPKRKILQEDLGTFGTFIQLKFYEPDNTLDNNIKLYNQAFKLLEQEIR